MRKNIKVELEYTGNLIYLVTKIHGAPTVEYNTQTYRVGDLITEEVANNIARIYVITVGKRK